MGYAQVTEENQYHCVVTIDTNKCKHDYKV